MAGRDGADTEVERDVMFLLGGVVDPAELEEICTVLSLKVPDALKGKVKPLYKLVMRYLTSEEVENMEDQGKKIFLLLRDHLSHSEDWKGSAEIPGSGEEPTGSKVTSSRVSMVDVQRLKDFKISGTIGCSERKDSLSFSSLNFQISNGLKQGYSEEAICAAVLRAISPGNNLRTYLESKKFLKISSILDVLRSHFHEKDSSSVFTELSNGVQEASESCLDFVIRMMCLRQKILTLGVEEGSPYDENIIQRRFLHTIETGLRNTNIRYELRELLTFSAVKPLTDEKLLRAVSEAIANDNERSGKLSGRKRDFPPAIKAVQFSEKDPDMNSSELKKKRENQLQIQLQELKINQEKELAALRNDLCEIKSALANRPHDNSFSGNRDDKRMPLRNRKYKCQNCFRDRVVKCNHCLVCGSSDHYRMSCPQVEKNE